jgi:hypothetical protein
MQFEARLILCRSVLRADDIGVTFIAVPKKSVGVRRSSRAIQINWNMLCSGGCKD